MFFDRRWIVHEFEDAFKSGPEFLAKLEEFGVSPGDDHVPFLAVLALAVDRVRTLNDELCGMTERSVPFGTWEMLVRSMLTARTLESALFTLMQSARLFNLPYQIDLREHNDIILLGINVDGKKKADTSFLEAAYLRLICTAMCWFCGRQIELMEIWNSQTIYQFDNRNSDGSIMKPLKSGGNIDISDHYKTMDGFAFSKNVLYYKSAINRDSDPLLENFKWFGILDYSPKNDGQIDARNLQRTEYCEAKLPRSLLKNTNQGASIGTNDDMLKAKIMLSATKLTIAEISFQLGFKSEQNFRKRFHSICGETPTIYRERHESKELIGTNHLFDQIINALK